MVIFTDKKPVFGFIYEPKSYFGIVAVKPARNFYNMWMR